MSDPRKMLFQHIDEEKASQTDFFVSFLSYSDIHRVLNAIHKEDDIVFDNSAEIVATKQDGLPKNPPENEVERKFDWVIKDESKLVGYKSPDRDEIDSEQLREERRKLEYNADSRDVHFFVITDNLQKPDFEAEATWKRWYDVGKAVIGIEQKSKTVEMMAEMFKEQGYEGFTGFTEFQEEEEWFVKHQREAADFVLEVMKYAEDLELYENKIDPHDRVEKDIREVKKENHVGFGLPYYDFPVYPDGSQEEDTNYDKSEWYIALIIPALHNRVYVQMNTYPSTDERAKEILKDNAQELTDILKSNKMYLQTSRNSLFSEPPESHFERGKILNVLNKGELGEDSFERLRFGWEVDTQQAAEAIVKEAAKKMERLHEIFYDGVKRRTEFELAEE